MEKNLSDLKYQAFPATGAATASLALSIVFSQHSTSGATLSVP
jgi:hypothetical protein